MSKHHTPLAAHLHPSAYGGVLRNRRLGRGARSLSSKYSMHLVLRSSQARGDWSFVRPRNRHMIEQTLAKHASRTGAVLLGLGNAGNHLHLRARFTNRAQYFKFIRSICGEIALKIKKISRQNQKATTNSFWDKRPFSSIVSGLKYVARLSDYIKINHLEGIGYTRAYARLVVRAWSNTGYSSA